MNGLVKGRVDIRKTLISLVLIGIVEFIAFYMFIPAINISSIGFWFFQGVFVLLFFLTTFTAKSNDVLGYNILTKIVGIAMVVAVVLVIVGSFFSAKIFNASKYASLIEVEEREFAADTPSAEKTVNDIALMDTASAKVVGQRAIGSLSDVISQYEIIKSYSTIDYDGQPMKVASLGYAGFFKWFNNRDKGVPGFVFVDPVKFEARYQKLDKAIKYSPSGYFNDNLYRHLRFKYPTYIFEGYYFEVDNEGNPYYICPVIKPRVGLFGAFDVKGAVICDPCTGDCKYYKVGDIPNWVDRVYDGDLATRKYNWYGTLKGGFINSIIGQKGCKMSTDDYGYKVIDGDVWVYTGVTSVIGDQSNVGFVLINARTCQAIYYTIAGAEEYSAMDAAEGQVQNLGYKAAFPSLINIDGEPTYFMVLKDKSKLVKMYAMVNYKKYSIVATGTTQKDALSNYKKLLKTNGIVKGISEDMYKTKQTEVASIRYIDLSGDTYCYITDGEGSVYKQLFAENESLIFIKEGDMLNVTYEESEDRINQLISYDKINN
ncbi:MAG: hypothetical protein E7254_01260 [Lachnospiraceae bacterium]|nr:hypothetical protein [Lachnospiraceae bacterium]